jgi:tetrapyrrole methylase family protein/MazG family protein
VVEAIADGPSAAVMEELGDVLLQVYLHAEIADQEGDFSLNDIVRTLSEKLIRRHPHVFGEVSVSGASEVVKNWDVLKAAEKGIAAPVSALKRINRALPSLSQAAEMMGQAAKAGFEWHDRRDALAKVREELAELLDAESVADKQEELGDLLWMLVYLGRRDGVDAEEALRAGVRKFDRRFRAMEALAIEHGWDGLHERTTSELLETWEEAKARVRAEARS